MESEFYLQALREWDERYGDLVLGKRIWQIASAGLMLLSLILPLGIVWTSARTKVIPFLVEVDMLGYAITIPAALTARTSPEVPTILAGKSRVPRGRDCESHAPDRPPGFDRAQHDRSFPQNGRRRERDTDARR
jgi:hypothetical protein